MSATQTPSSADAPARAPKTLPSFQQLLYDEPAPHVARITMNRPERRNAQGLRMIYEINEAFTFAAHDDDIKVVILAGAGPDFNSGHDLSGEDRTRMSDISPLGTWGQFSAKGHEGFYAREREIYLDITERWRNLSKPTIAQLQGRCIAGGLMLAWACDLIVASDDALFRDTTTDMNVAGAEFWVHPFEMGVRKAKEFLFTADWLSAQDAHRLGMVNHVVPRAELDSFTLALAGRIAEKEAFVLKMAKEAINHAQDQMGRRDSMMFGFALHQLCHAHNMQVYGFPISTERLAPAVRKRIEELKAKSGTLQE